MDTCGAPRWPSPKTKKSEWGSDGDATATPTATTTAAESISVTVAALATLICARAANVVAQL